ncbi:hypothetical protein GCM10007415_03010 [Parapedobacter pyrenivorans]|uniref:Thioredoxin-like fold domain-containing protein n=1 Tax=Parapedobacter pyrenivorans TaxID=1305674 RepID=A0A917HCU7_9SPHI|nr:thioredoxin family protein [Parapedobacter pyrenivorans]GGG74866.1 hypothetical protein GCM10007415_03010 [Parapedobacter pyrenivorans]
MKRSFHYIGLVFAITILLFPEAQGQVKSIPIGELADSMRSQSKPALILITTEWCTYCQMQKAQLRKNADFQSASADFHFSEFDAETRDPIVFADTTYHFKNTGVSTGRHDLAYMLGNQHNRLAFPTWVLVNENLEIIFKYPGILKPSDLEALIGALRRDQTLKK